MGKNLIAHFFAVSTKNIKLPGVLRQFDAMIFLTACGEQTTTQQPTEPFQKTRHAEITVQDYGTIKLELDEGTAPITVANFIKLAKDGFYDGLAFHRIMDGVMIQGGDPDGNGTGGSKDKIKGEFSKNGVINSATKYP